MADDDQTIQPQAQAQASPADVMQGDDSTQQQTFDPFAARPELIDSIIQHESSGRPGAVSPKGAKGLMQVMPQTAAQYGVTPQQLMDPDINKQVGTQYFSDLLKQYKGNEFLALVAYNEGPGNLSKGRFLPQSVHYATSVLDGAGSRLKGLWQGAESALGFGGGQQQQQPQQSAQPQAAAGPQQPGMIAGLLGKIGGGISSLLGEGTAEAEETPPDATGAAPPGAAPPGAPPPAPPAAPPPPAGGGGGVRVDASGRMIMPAAPAPPPAAARPPSQPALERQSLMVDSTGKFSERFAAKKIPEQMVTSAGASKLGLAALDRADETWRTQIAPHEKDFEGTYWNTPVNALRGVAQYSEYTHSRFLDPVGLQVDPGVAKFYSQVGPIIGMQLKAIVGGRIGQYMIDGPLAAHIPSGEHDSLRMMHEKLQNLRPILQDNLRIINSMREAGASEDDQFAAVIQNNHETPVWQGGHVVGAVPDEGE